MPSSELDDDRDISEERERVLSGDADDDLVCLKNLTKVGWNAVTSSRPIIGLRKIVEKPMGDVMSIVISSCSILSSSLHHHRSDIKYY